MSVFPTGELREYDSVIKKKKKRTLVICDNMGGSRKYCVKSNKLKKDKCLMISFI